MGTIADTMQVKLLEAFAPTLLEIADDSARHAGHAGNRSGGESHFNVTIVSAAFDGLTRIERYRRVQAVLADELAGPVHALSLKLLTPDEAER